MNYFEIFNKVLLELNLRPVGTFEEIYKSEHKKILNAINLVNKEVLSSYDWPFLIKRRLLDVPAGECSVKLPLYTVIKSVYHKNERFKFVENPENIFTRRVSGNVYSILNGSLILPKSNSDRLFDVYFYSKEYVAAPDGSFKTDFDAALDVSVLPMPYAEGILVYGACLKAKGNPAYPKFGFWNTMYVNALKNLHQKSPQTRECGPSIKI